MMERIPARVKIASLLVLAIIGSLGLGFSLEAEFSRGLVSEGSWGMRFIPVVLTILLSATFLTFVSLTASRAVRAGGAALSALAFGLTFVLPPNPVEIPLGFTALLAVAYLGSIVFLDYFSRRAIKKHVVFEASMFSPAYSRFFQLFVLAVGILVYFATRLPADGRLKIPEEIINPSLNLIVNRVIEQVGGELGSSQLTGEQFIAEIEKSGLLEVLEQQFGIVLNPQDISSPQNLAEKLRQPLAEQLTKDLEDFLEPYLPFLPLAAALGAALSLFFLSSLFAWLAVGAFALTYRVLIWLRFARIEQEQRQVPVLKI